MPKLIKIPNNPQANKILYNVLYGLFGLLVLTLLLRQCLGMNDTYESAERELQKEQAWLRELMTKDVSPGVRRSQVDEVYKAIEKRNRLCNSSK